MNEVPVEIFGLRSATIAYLAVLRDVDAWAEREAVASGFTRPRYAAQLDRLRDEIQTALLPREMGTPAAILRALGELEGESHQP